jgi:hypothetical protein
MLLATFGEWLLVVLGWPPTSSAENRMCTVRCTEYNTTNASLAFVMGTMLKTCATDGSIGHVCNAS